MNTASRPPGWHDDPVHPGRMRWWDGRQWGPETIATPHSRAQRSRLAVLAQEPGSGRTGVPRQRKVVAGAVVGGLALMISPFVLMPGPGGISGEPEVAARSPSATAASETPPPWPTVTPTPSPTPSPTGTPRAAPSPTVPAAPTIPPDEVIKPYKLGSKPKPPKMLTTAASRERVGAICRDGTHSSATGSGACSWHGGVASWISEVPGWVSDNKAENTRRTKAYKAALKKWTGLYDRNQLLKKYPCSKGPFKKGGRGYATWRDTNDNGLACDATSRG